MEFVNIDPVAFSVGPLDVRWYGLAYVAGILIGLWMAGRIARRYSEFEIQPRAFEEFSTWAILGVVIGGRLGSILLYNLDFYLEHPLRIFAIHEGGMAFHGGLLGVAVAALIFCVRKKIRFFAFTDIVACVAPIGLFLGRLANYINGELWGRPTDLPWAVVFPNPAAGGMARHPSQLYEAALEGGALFIVLNFLLRLRLFRSNLGLLTGVFLIGYSVSRFLVEFTREPDAPLIGMLTRGQAYSLPMFIAGIVLIGKIIWGRVSASRLLSTNS